jgi:predicted  nucleic acid-binding Zn-ribbon protein
MLQPELEVLLEIQDLKMLRRDVQSSEYAATGLPVDSAEYGERLGALIAEREAKLSPRVAATYKRIASRHDRVVAQVINGVCSGCHVHVPTSRGRDKDRRAEIRNCESCGRFLWYTE